MAAFLGALWDDVDEFGSFSVKNQLELIEDTNKSFKRKRPSKAPDEFGIESGDEAPMSISKKKQKTTTKFEPLDNKTLEMRNNKQRKRRTKDLNLDDYGIDVNSFDGINLPNVNAGRQSITYVPLSKFKTRYNEFENEEIYSSCEELPDSDDENIPKESIPNTYKPTSESARLLEIMKANKNLGSIVNDDQKSPGQENSEREEPHDDLFDDIRLSPNTMSTISGTSKRGGGDGDDMGFECLKKFQDSIKPKGRRSKICFGCMFGNKDDGSIDASPFNTLMDIIKHNYGSIGNRFLARTAHCYFKIHIRKPMLLRNKYIPNWRSADILDHIESHTKDPVINAGQSIERARKILSIVQNMIFRIRFDASGEPLLDFDKGALRAYTDLEKMIITLYKLVPKEMLFYSETFRIEPSTLGKFVNMNKDIEFVK
jgi:hypothetical protein